MKPVLEIKNISKEYRIAHESRPYLSIRDSLAGLFSPGSTKYEKFYALNDVSFNVMPGQAVGIIGKNGAGKSTLLKILSKITPPTSGSIICRGRMASLLEVGTGFHPELTGRENIYFNGSILGMKKKEIERNFDSIVDFSGVEKFIDTPLKHYSSGMQLRLAFSVAAFLESEIIVIDEVLAVGDSEFQKKCLGKMEDISRNNGKTILFVSHQLGSVSTLCSSGILLEKGSIRKTGPVAEVIETYITNSDNRYIKSAAESDKEMFFEHIAAVDAEGNPKEVFGQNAPVTVRIKIKVRNRLKGAKIGIGLNNKYNNRVFTIYEYLEYDHIDGDTLQVNVTIPEKLIAPNYYTFSAAVYLYDNRFIDKVENVCGITIMDEGSKYAAWEGIDYGDVIVNCKVSYGNKLQQKA